VIYGYSPKTTAFEKVEERMTTLLDNFDHHRQKNIVQQQILMSGDNNTVVIEKVLKAFAETPQDFFCS
jgi:hypothetical protein